jgi:diguanylate cyclase (GGDEF)-like protein
MLHTVSRSVSAVFGRLWPYLSHPASITRWLTALSFAVACGMLALGTSILFDLRTDAWHRSEQASNNLILALSRDIARSINLYDLSLQGAMAALTEPALAQADPEVRHMALFDRAATAEYLGTMMVVNARGDIVAQSTSLVPTPINIGFREHFLVQQRRPDVGLFISRSFEGRLVNDPTIALTRRITNPDGSFGGIVEGTIRTAYFRDLFANLDIGPNGSVTLFRNDGRVIMRRPFRPEDIDKDLGNAETFRTYLTAPHGHFVGTAALDHVKRLYTFHQIGDLPLILSVAIAVDDIYTEWWRKATGIGVILLALCVASVVLCLLFRREILRRMVAEDSLKEAARRLSFIAATDPLTGIPNRRSFEDALSSEWRRATRAQTSLAVMMLDVDYFKSFNDRYGHPTGDEILRSIAMCIARAMCRAGDMGARYGGEEFIAVLADTERAGAFEIAESIRAAVIGLAIPHAGSPIGYVTISIGVAVARPLIGDRMASVVKAADDALYEAKRCGRNRVVLDAESEATLADLETMDLTGVHQPG